jgi:hypothetical protein
VRLASSLTTSSMHSPEPITVARMKIRLPPCAR